MVMETMLATMPDPQKELRQNLYQRLVTHHGAQPGEAHEYYRELLDHCLSTSVQTTRESW